jgi:hypothetical protein
VRYFGQGQTFRGDRLILPEWNARFYRSISMPEWWNGRRAGFKIQYPQKCVGSSPTFGTIFLSKPTMNIALLAAQLIFIYEPYESASAPCTHSIVSQSNPYDHRVICTDEKGLKHEFVAHVALSKYTHPTPPRVSYELLYWVNDNGASTIFNFEKDTALMSLESSQSIIGESAGLRLKIKL